MECAPEAKRHELPRRQGCNQGAPSLIDPTVEQAAAPLAGEFKDGPAGRQLQVDRKRVWKQGSPANPSTVIIHAPPNDAMCTPPSSAECVSARSMADVWRKEWSPSSDRSSGAATNPCIARLNELPWLALASYPCPFLFRLGVVDQRGLMTGCRVMAAADGGSGEWGPPEPELTERSPRMAVVALVPSTLDTIQVSSHEPGSDQLQFMGAFSCHFGVAHSEAFQRIENDLRHD
jgi:hypothetical protein